MNHTQTLQPANALQTPEVRPGTYNPVSFAFSDSLGVLFLGILSLMLMVQLMRMERRLRQTDVH